MSANNDGGPAFPQQLSDGQRERGSSNEFGLGGMTLRDWFATFYTPKETDVLSLLDANRMANPHGDGPPKPRRITADEAVCLLKYQHADSMLKARAL